jgi:phosphomecalonate degydratase small subunit
MGGENTVMKIYKGKSVVKMGVIEGETLVTKDLVAFWGGADWATGEIVEVGHEARGKKVAGKILVFPIGKGGGGETFGYYYLARSGNAPKALLCNRSLGQTVAGALLTNTPMVYGFKEDIVSAIQTGDIVRVDTEKGEVEVVKKVSSR